MIGVDKSLFVFAETCGTEQRSPTANTITNVLKIEFDCRRGATAVSLVSEHEETTAYCHVRRCGSRGDQDGTNDTADAAACDICGGQVKSFKTKSEREFLEVHVQKGSPDVLKIVFREMVDEHPDADSDDVFATTGSELAVSSGEAAESKQQSQSLLVKLSLLGSKKYSATTGARIHRVSW